MTVIYFISINYSFRICCFYNYLDKILSVTSIKNKKSEMLFYSLYFLSNILPFDRYKDVLNIILSYFENLSRSWHSQSVRSTFMFLWPWKIFSSSFITCDFIAYKMLSLSIFFLPEIISVCSLHTCLVYKVKPTVILRFAFA